MKTRRDEDRNEICKVKDVNVRMNVMYNMCACYYREYKEWFCTLPRNFRREKTLGEMWAAVIRTICKQPPPNGVASDAGPPNGDRAGVSRCSEGYHEGRIREVPQEERSPSMYIALNVCIVVKRNFNLITSIAGKNHHLRLHWSRYWCIYVYSLIPARSSFIFSHVQDVSYNNRCLFFVG
jgi:hypothetical protein